MVEPKPAETPIWNTGGANRTDPMAAKKVLGWELNEAPPSSYFNWLMHYTGAGFVWLYERLNDGALEHDVTLSALQPDAAGRGGDLTLDAGSPLTSGRGGAISMSTKMGTNDAGGDFTLTCGGGDSGVGGAITMTAGDGDGAEGGDVNVTAGGGNIDGGDVVVTGGDVVSTDNNGGNIVLRTGAGTGTGFGRVFVEVSESGTTGATPNAVQEYIRCDGATAAQNVQVNRFLRVENASDTTRGVARFIPKAQPTAPTIGDLYLDTNTDQLAVYNGARYYNFNTIVKNISDDGVVGETPANVASITLVLNEKPYGGSVGVIPLRHIIPANTLRSGSIIRVRAQFLLTELAAGGTFPSPRVYVGAIGPEAPAGEYRSPTGVQILPVDSSALTWASTYGAVECEMRVRGTGATANVDTSWRVVYSTTNGDVQAGTIYNTDTIDTTAALDVFPVCQFGTGGGYDLEAEQFIVEVI